MRIVIDLQGAQSPGSRVRGIGRYSLSFVEALARGAGDHDVWVALNHAIPDVVDELKDRLCPHVPESRVVVWESVPGTSAARCIRSRCTTSSRTCAATITCAT